MAMTDTSPEIDTTNPVDPSHSEVVRKTQPTAFERLVGSGDHRTTGRLFIGFSTAFLAAGILLSVLVDVDVATDQSLFRPDITARMVMNAHIGVFLLGIVPLLLGLAIVVVPAQLGSATLAFPRAAAAALWSWLGASLVFVTSVATDGSYGGGIEKTARLGNVAVGAIMLSLCLAAVCVAVTVLAQRPGGLTLARVPFFSFAMLVFSTIVVLTLPASLAHVILGHITRSDGAALAATTYPNGLAWLFLAPTVYVLLVPVLGILADVAATAVGARQRGRGLVQSFIGLAGFLSFGAWAQTTAGRSTLVWSAFVVCAALPLLGVTGAIGDTLRQSKPKLMSPLGFSVFAVLIGLLGVGIGLLQVINSIGKGELGKIHADLVQTSEFRAVVGAAALAALGGIFYWGRNLFGAALADTPGKALAPAVALGVTLWSVPWLVAGISPTDAAIAAWIAAAGGAILALAVLVVLGAGIYARFVAASGDGPIENDWGVGGTLEWRDALVGTESVESPYPLLDGKLDGKDAS